jgi:hypothetical protein
MFFKKFGVNQRTHFLQGWKKIIHIGYLKGRFYLTVFENNKPVSGRTFKTWDECNNYIIKLSEAL